MARKVKKFKVKKIFQRLGRVGSAFVTATKAANQTFHKTLRNKISGVEEPNFEPTALIDPKEFAKSDKKSTKKDKPEKTKKSGNKPKVEVVKDSGNLPVYDENNPLWENRGFWAYLDSFLAAQNSEHTRRAYEKDLVDFLSYLKTTKKPMNVHTLVSYRERLKTRTSERTGNPLSHVSINRKMATIKSFLNWLVLNGMLPNNPARAVKSFRAGRESPTRDIPDDMVKRMFQMPYRHTVAGRMHFCILNILFHMGLRRSELCSLRTSDIFEREGMNVLRVRGKGDKERVLPIPDPVFKSIEQYLIISKKDQSEDQVLFNPVKNNVTKTKDKPLHPNSIAYIVQYYAKLAGVQYKVSPHSARATAVSNALDNHAPHRSVQHMAGWSSPLMVTRYDKRKEELKNSAVHFVKYSEEQS